MMKLFRALGETLSETLGETLGEDNGETLMSRGDLWLTFFVALNVFTDKFTHFQQYFYKTIYVM